MEFYNPNITEIELQYDAIYNDEIVGSLIFRHGYFSVEYKGQLVYEAYPKGDGIFEYEEREYYLRKAKKALMKKIIAN